MAAVAAALQPTDVPAGGSGAAVMSDAEHAADYGVPTLQAMGYPPITSPQVVLFPGGETAALCRMEKMLRDKAWVSLSLLLGLRCRLRLLFFSCMARFGARV